MANFYNTMNQPMGPQPGGGMAKAIASPIMQPPVAQPTALQPMRQVMPPRRAVDIGMVPSRFTDMPNSVMPIGVAKLPPQVGYGSPHLGRAPTPPRMPFRPNPMRGNDAFGGDGINRVPTGMEATAVQGFPTLQNWYAAQQPTGMTPAAGPGISPQEQARRLLAGMGT